MRTLALRKDVLTELTTDELTAVVGADATGILCVTDPCITNPATYLGCASRQTHC